MNQDPNPCYLYDRILTPVIEKLLFTKGVLRSRLAVALAFYDTDCVGGRWDSSFPAEVHQKRNELQAYIDGFNCILEKQIKDNVLNLPSPEEYYNIQGVVTDNSHCSWQKADKIAEVIWEIYNDASWCKRFDIIYNEAM